MRRVVVGLFVAIACVLALGATSHAQQQPQTFAQSSRSTASWTSATAQDTALTTTIAGFSSMTVTLSVTSPITAGGLVFEADDGTGTWWSESCTRNDGFRAESAYAISVVPRSWECDTGGWTSFRVRLNPAIVGGGTVTLNTTPTAAPSEPSVTIGQLDPTQLQTTSRAASDDPLLRAVVALNASLNALRLRVGGSTVPVFAMNPVDPCQGPKGNVAISQTASTRLVIGQAGKRIAVCWDRIVAGVAEIPSYLEGTGAACGTATLAVSGSTTAANGMSVAANGGFNGGAGGWTIATTKVPGNDLCLGQSGAGLLAGNATYVYY